MVTVHVLFRIAVELAQNSNVRVIDRIKAQKCNNLKP
jgi:hypothetical protein